MVWNYRVVKRVTPAETIYAIHEAYYAEDKTVDAITQDAVGLTGATPEELHKAWSLMEEAFRAPVLDYDTRKEIARLAVEGT